MDEHHDAGGKAEEAGDYASAEQHYEIALARARSGQPPDKEVISMTAYNLGRIKGYVCKKADAERLLLEALELETEVSGPGSDVTTMRYFELARLYYDYGQFDNAVSYYSRGIPAVKALGVETDDPIGMARELYGYSTALEKVGRIADAQAAKQEADDLQARNSGEPAKGAPVRYNRSCPG